MITGQYGHNNGVLANRPGYGALTDRRSTLPAWLRAAGYRTAHVGRWMNGFRKFGGGGAAPGWDSWFTMGESQTYFGYKVNDDGSEIRFGKGRRDYVTRVLNQAALKVIRREVGSSRPFYLQLDHIAPHADGANGEKTGPCAHSAIPPSRAPTGFETTPLPTPPSFNEADVGDKPSFVADAPAAQRRRRSPSSSARTAAGSRRCPQSTRACAASSRRSPGRASSTTPRSRSSATTATSSASTGCRTRSTSPTRRRSASRC